jgi:hypothetical protein
MSIAKELQQKYTVIIPDQGIMGKAPTRLNIPISSWLPICLNLPKK